MLRTLHIDIERITQAIVVPALRPDLVPADNATGLPVSKNIAQEHINRGDSIDFQI